MRSNISVNEMALFVSFPACVKGKTFLGSHGERGGLPTRRDSGPTRYGCAPHWHIWLWWRFGVFSYTVWCAIVAGEICSESSDRLGSARVAGIVRDSVFKPCVLLSWVLKLDDQTLLHLRVKGIANDLNRFCGRNVLWCAGDGGRGVCSSDVHRLVQKPVSAAEMQFTHATRSPRANQIAGRVVCGSKVDIAAGVSARDSVAMEKSFLQLVFEVLCDATATLVQLPDCRPPHSLYTLASEPQPSVRESCVVCASSNGLWWWHVQACTVEMTP